MGVLCSKEFRLKVGKPVDTSRLVYYKLDAYSLGTVDSSQGKNMGAAPSAPLVVPGIISNGFDPSPGGIFMQSPADTWFDVRGLSFTMRIWVNPLPDTGGGTRGLVLALIPTGGIGTCSLSLFPDGSGNFYPYFEGRLAAGLDFIQGDPDIVPGTWNELIAWISANNEIGLQWNGGTPVTHAIVGGLTGTSPFDRLRIIVSDPNLGLNASIIDELAFWKGYVLTSGERSTDWNGGAGRTFPDVP